YALRNIVCDSGIPGIWSGLSPTLVSALPSTITYILPHLNNSFSKLLAFRQSGQTVESGMPWSSSSACGASGALGRQHCSPTSLSKVLRRKDDRLIGLKSFGVVCEGFPALGIKTILAFSQARGIFPTVSIFLKLLCSQLMAMSPAF
ncbi:Hypothetical predicted protein, partial [Drosophila guanche]